ncbi:MAG: hypothetical protein ABR551_04090, partial [Gemmatimonadales bacterium]
MAESLRRLPEPVEAVLSPPIRLEHAPVLRAMASALLPALAPDAPPAWLRPGQSDAFRRAVAAVRQYGG